MNTREIRQIAKDFRRGLNIDSPEMMCAVVTYPLHGYLAFLGQHSTVEEVDLGRCNHVFLRLPDGRVLDATGDQFGEYPAIYIGNPLWFHVDKPKRITTLGLEDIHAENYQVEPANTR